jgi:hypothetical protein
MNARDDPVQSPPPIPRDEACQVKYQAVLDLGFVLMNLDSGKLSKDAHARTTVETVAMASMRYERLVLHLQERLLN